MISLEGILCFKDYHKLGLNGGRTNADRICNSDVIVLSNNDIVLRSKKAQTLQPSLKVYPLIPSINFNYIFWFCILERQTTKYFFFTDVCTSTWEGLLEYILQWPENVARLKNPRCYFQVYFCGKGKVSESVIDSEKRLSMSHFLGREKLLKPFNTFVRS